jgi:membrane associated rhomboid family serine protease
MHLGGNMLYLWIFGNNIEDVMGRTRFIIFYLLCGIIAIYAHAAVDPESQIPMVGASGAVSGILGAYLLLFPGARILTLVPLFIFVTTVRIPALVFLGGWFLFQILPGFFMPREQGGIAWFAHIGGFLAGMGLIFFFRKRGVA